MWGLLLLASLLMAPSLGCIPCDTRGMEAMDRWKNIIQEQVVEPEIEGYAAIKDVAKYEEKKILEFLEDVGALDEEAISAIVTAYETAVNITEETDSTGEHLLIEMENTFRHLKEEMEVIVEEAENRRCPNKQDKDNCGLLVQTYTVCKTCDKVKKICAGGSAENQEFFDTCSCVCTDERCIDLKNGSECTPCGDHTSHLADAIDCGERNVTVMENNDLDLSCDLDWFASLEDEHKYVFSKTTYPVPRISDDPDIILQEIETPESGQYTCFTLLSSGVPISKITYNVKVLSGSEEVAQVHEPMPALLTIEETPTPDVPRDPTSPEPMPALLTKEETQTPDVPRDPTSPEPMPALLTIEKTPTPDVPRDLTSPEPMPALLTIEKTPTPDVPRDLTSPEPMQTLLTKEEIPTPGVPCDLTSPEPIIQDAGPSIRQIVTYVALASNSTVFFGIIICWYVTRRSKNPEDIEQG